jgi:hypothetical protein
VITSIKKIPQIENRLEEVVKGKGHEKLEKILMEIGLNVGSR